MSMRESNSKADWLFVAAHRTFRSKKGRNDDVGRGILAAVVWATLLLSGCAVGPNYVRPKVNAPADFRGAEGATQQASFADLPWWEAFKDEQLKTLIATALANNYDLAVAVSRVEQARQLANVTRAQYFPSVGYSVGASNGKNEFLGSVIPGSGTTKGSFLAFGSAAWEADIWGRLGSAKKASLAGLLGTEAGARAIQSEIVSEIASLYYILLALDQQVIITEQTVKNWDTTVTTMQSLQASARVTEAAVVQCQAQRDAAAVTIPDLYQNIRATENALSILLGVPPADISRNRLEDQSAIPILNTGIPAQLLANRPDVQQAEQAYRYAFELTNVARTAFYPSLTITGSAGYSSFSVSSFFDLPALGASIVGGLFQPILNRRLNKTKLEVAKEQQQAALLSFKTALLVAGREVSDALSLHVAARDKMMVRSSEITALQQSVAYTQELLQNGFANYTEVITARQSLLAAELERVNDKLQELQSIVSLYVALGGGWRS